MANKIVKLDALVPIASALSAETRVKIIKLLLDGPLNVTEIADQLKMPISSAISAVLKLEEAGLLSTYTQGKKKICVVDYQTIVLQLVTSQHLYSDLDSTISYSVPIGDYFNYQAIPSCGLLGNQKFIGMLDSSEAFSNPNHIFAKLIWMRNGFLEYHIDRPEISDKQIKSLSISFEICSEYPGYNNSFPSDLVFSLNGTDIWRWTSRGDFGGRYGIFTPHWWKLNNTQYGDLVTCSITNYGAYVNSEKVSDITINELNLADADYMVFKISTLSTGGFNLFGKGFGDFNQDISVRIDFQDKSDTSESAENGPALPGNQNYADYISESVKKHIHP